MNRVAISGMGLEQLERHVELLAKQSLQEGLWESLSESDLGKRMADMLRSDREDIRDSYSAIVASDPAAPEVLSGLQGEERRVNSYLARLTNSKEHKKSIDSEIEFVKNLIVERRRLAR